MCRGGQSIHVQRWTIQPIMCKGAHPVATLSAGLVDSQPDACTDSNSSKDVFRLFVDSLNAESWDVDFISAELEHMLSDGLEVNHLCKRLLNLLSTADPDAPQTRELMKVTAKALRQVQKFIMHAGEVDAPVDAQH